MRLARTYERQLMAVNISIDWHFVGQDDDAHVRYALTTYATDDVRVSKGESVSKPIDTILPLGTSVLAPGLSMAVPAR